MIGRFRHTCDLSNSINDYFLPLDSGKHKIGLDCKTVRIFAYSRTREQSNKRSGMGLKTESETAWGETLRACEASALRARKTLTPRFTDFFTDFEKKTDRFAV